MTLQTWLDAEAEACINRLTVLLESGPADFDTAALHRAARRLGGVARLAGATGLAHVTAMITDATRSSGAPPPGRVRERLGKTLDALRMVAQAGAERPDPSLVDAVAEGWRDLSSAQRAGAPNANEEAAFLDWAAREIAGFADTLDNGIAQFASEPDDREWIGAILHRLRSLLGAAKLGDVAVVGETLIAVDELTQVIVRLDVPVKMEWLDVFRTARDTLRAAVTSLAQGERPDPVPALSRLRTLRAELMDRYGSNDREAPPAAARKGVSSGWEAESVRSTGSLHGGEFTSFAPPAPDAATDVRTRAEALRPVIENAIGGDAAARVALEALYGLLRRSNP